MEIGTGWIGWTEEQTLDTSMPGIERAYKGRVAMLRAIFGGKDPGTKSISKSLPVSLVMQLHQLKENLVRTDGG